MIWYYAKLVMEILSGASGQDGRHFRQMIILARYPGPSLYATGQRNKYLLPVQRLDNSKVLGF